MEAAKLFSYYDILIVHSDADAPSAEKAKDERFTPGNTLVQHCVDTICKNVVPIIPIQATESWMIADYETLLKEIGTAIPPDKLGIPRQAKLTERIAHPKRVLEEAVHTVNMECTRRRRVTDITFLYEPMGYNSRLSRLKELSSYQQFITDLTTTLKALNLIQ